MTNWRNESELKTILTARRHEKRMTTIGLIILGAGLGVTAVMFLVAFINGMEVLTN